MDPHLIHEFLNPQLSLSMQIFIRATYGILLLGQLLMLVPHSKRFFISEKWKGYAESTPAINLIQNPRVMPVLMTIWIACATCIATGNFVFPAAAINLVFCHYFFIQMRWKGLARGLGAPGFMSYWLSQCIFWLELTLNFAPTVRSLAVLVFSIDFAMIMASAGYYKYLAGYSRHEGMEYGMVNPMWGYFPKFFTKVPPSNAVYNFLDQMAWSMEILAAVLMFIPATRLLGGFIIWGSFLFVATQIRLNLLCWVVMLCCFLYSSPGDIVDNIVYYSGASKNAFNKQIKGVPFASLVPSPVKVATVASDDSSATASAEKTGVEAVISKLTTPSASVGELERYPTNPVPAVAAVSATLLWTYLCLMLLSHFGLYYNFLGKKRLPGILQTGLEKFTNTFGLIIWRVFTADLCNFYAVIKLIPRNDYKTVDELLSVPAEQKKLVTDYGWTGSRYRHVCESITVCSLFTTLKYYPSNSPLFKDKLIRYAKTLGCPDDCVVEFEYVSIQKGKTYSHDTKSFYLVDCVENTLTELVVDSNFSAKESNKFVPLHESSRPGSYAPPAVKVKS